MTSGKVKTIVVKETLFKFMFNWKIIDLQCSVGYVCVLVAQSCLTLCDLRNAAHQAPLSIEFSRQTYWSGLLFTSPLDLPYLGIKPRSPALQEVSLLSEPPEKPVVLIRNLLKRKYTGKTE